MPSKTQTTNKLVPLDMSHRSLTQFSVPVLPHYVTHLYLNNNSLKQLPNDFFLQFHKLEWLDLRNNELECLPSRLPKAHSYSELGRKQVLIKIENSEGRQILHPAISSKDEEDNNQELVLHTILLQNNALREIPKVLQQIRSLRVIQLHGNPCASVATIEQRLSKVEKKMAKNDEYLMQLLQPPPTLKRKSSLSFFPAGKDPIQITKLLPTSHDVRLSLEDKVQQVTLQRQLDRQRQLQQIQVDRQIQNSKDIEAMANFRRTFYAKGTSPSSIQARRPPPLGRDRDTRVAQRSQIQFGNAEMESSDTALDQLSAEMDRVLQRRYQFDGRVPSIEEINQSNEEVGRVLGNIRKARILQGNRPSA